MLRIITDSAEFTENELRYLGVYSIPSQDASRNGISRQLAKLKYHKIMRSTKDTALTDQPLYGSYERIMRACMENGDTAVIITMSSELSGSYKTAKTLKDMLGFTNCYIIDSRTTMQGERTIVQRASQLRNEGFSAIEIACELMIERKKKRRFINLDLLDYLFPIEKVQSATA